MNTEEQFPAELEVDQAGSGFADWWASEGHQRYEGKFTRLDDMVSIKQVARDAWHNARHEMVNCRVHYAELLLYAPFPTTLTVELNPLETRAQALERFTNVYGQVNIVDDKGRGELAAVHFFDRIIAQCDELKFTSDPVNKEVIDFREGKL